jgi:putative selenate reductase
MELIPQPLEALLRRMEREPASSEDRPLFDLPAAKQWHGSPPGLDLSRSFHHERAATVVGPAAGPHTQLAQNIALSYLAGARIMELKTVQVLDTLKIPRPCIDAANVGFNVEWSQELRIEQSIEEYAKAALLLAALKRAGLPDGLAPAETAHLFDVSLGYDLAGIQSEKVRGFIAAMLDASPVVERLAGALPPALRNHVSSAVEPRLASCVTLSTFHGCPAHEIEQIARHLMEAYRLHVVVKLNPTLLGFDDVQGILHDILGYRELAIRRPTFDKDLQWPDALRMIASLRETAGRVGVSFGVKLTNTLVVDNHKPFFSEKEMYLSGQPLHVLATQLYARLRSVLPLVGPELEPPVGYSFSAGIDQHNFAAAVAADLLPVTTCTDLLRPGGYGRLPKYLSALGEAMRRHGASDVEGYILGAGSAGEPEAAMADVEKLVLEVALRRGQVLTPETGGALRRGAALWAQGGLTPQRALILAGVPAELIPIAHPLWVHQAGTRNARRLATSALEDRRYRREQNAKLPKKIGSQLALFDCVNCDKCVPVCPNDANFAYQIRPLSSTAPTWILEGERLSEGPPEPVRIKEEHQLATFVDACNACGNCDVFCPEDGGPYVMKPHWFGGRKAFLEQPALDGFYLESRTAIVGRILGAELRLDVDPAARTARFEDARVALELELDRLALLSFRAKDPSAGPHHLSGARIAILAALLSGVQSTVNPVSMGLGDG